MSGRARPTCLAWQGSAGGLKCQVVHGHERALDCATASVHARTCRSRDASRCRYTPGLPLRGSGRQARPGSASSSSKAGPPRRSISMSPCAITARVVPSNTSGSRRAGARDAWRAGLRHSGDVERRSEEEPLIGATRGSAASGDGARAATVSSLRESGGQLLSRQRALRHLERTSQKPLALSALSSSSLCSRSRSPAVSRIRATPARPRARSRRAPPARAATTCRRRRR